MHDGEIIKLQEKVKKVLEPKRYEHTLGVAYTCANLAFVYDIDEEKAFLAGLLHDVAKCMSCEKRISICEKNNLEITQVEWENPVLLHAKVGAFLAKEKYGIEDVEICNAILYHTTGHPNMTMLEKIVYVADYIEPHRKKLPNMAQIRKMSYQDIDRAIYMILGNSLSYLEKGEQKVDATTRETYEYYKNLMEERGIL